MSDLTRDDLDDEQIREAEAGQVDEWISTARDLRYELFDRWEYQWTEAGCPGLLEHGQTKYPIPFTSAWWAAGPLLEELQGVKIHDFLYDGPWAVLQDTGSGQWHCAPTSGAPGPPSVETFVSAPTAPEAVSRVWLIAWSQGLVGGDDE